MAVMKKLLTILLLLSAFISNAQINVKWGKYTATYTTPNSGYTEEYNGAMSNWTDARLAFGLMGDGIADDTQALNDFFQATASGHQYSNNFQLPAGTYRTTKKITVIYRQPRDNDGTGQRLVGDRVGVHIVGDDPATTIIKYVGTAANDSAIISLYGFAYSYIGRITIDANNILVPCFAMSTINGVTNFDTGSKLEDMWFKNGLDGVRGGFTGYGFAECTMIRPRFINFTGSAIITANQNALDLWIWDGYFNGNSIALNNNGTSTLGDKGGNWHAINCTFKNSAQYVGYMASSAGFSFRGCYSASDNGDHTFFQTGGYSENAYLLEIQKCTIKKGFMYTQYQPQVVMMDNLISTRDVVDAANGAFLGFNSSGNAGNLVCIGNTWNYDPSTDGIYQFSNTNNLKVIDNHKVARAAAEALMSEPALPTVPSLVTRTVFEVYDTMTVAQIQSVINTASALIGQRPIVHFREGIPYNFGANGLTIPSMSDIQIKGDGHYGFSATSQDGHQIIYNGTVIYCDTTAFHFMGSKATISDLKIFGTGLNEGIVYEGVDGVNNKFLIEGYEGRTATQRLLYVDGLNTAKTIVMNSGFGYGESYPSSKAVHVRGGTSPSGAKTVVMCGLAIHQPNVFDVTNNGNLQATDIWNEWNGAVSPYINLTGSGKFSANGARVMSAAGETVSNNTIDGFNGQVTIVNADMTDRLKIQGDGTNTKVLSLTNFIHQSTYVADSSSPAAIVASVASSKANYGNNSSTMSDTGVSNPLSTADETYIQTMLAEIRNEPLPTTARDKNIKRVWVTNCLNNVVIKP